MSRQVIRLARGVIAIALAACDATEPPDPVDNRSEQMQDCGDGVCWSSEVNYCVADCGVRTSSCGNGVCDATETTATCVSDCPPPSMCGNLICDPGETAATCFDDCWDRDFGGCGDGFCDPPETSQSCPSDCYSAAVCGNGTCELAETSTSCAADCSQCALCVVGPVPQGCTHPEFDICTELVCDTIASCCTTSWTAACVDEAVDWGCCL